MDQEKITKFNYECGCGCGELVFEQWKDDGVAFISYNIPAHYAYQNGTWNNIKRTAKLIWSVITGKEYRFYEIVIEDNKTLQDFKRFVSEMREIDAIDK